MIWARNTRRTRLGMHVGGGVEWGSQAGVLSFLVDHVLRSNEHRFIDRLVISAKGNRRVLICHPPRYLLRACKNKMFQLMKLPRHL